MKPLFSSCFDCSYISSCTRKCNIFQRRRPSFFCIAGVCAGSTKRPQKDADISCPLTFPSNGLASKPVVFTAEICWDYLIISISQASQQCFFIGTLLPAQCDALWIEKSIVCTNWDSFSWSRLLENCCRGFFFSFRIMQTDKQSC